MLTYLAWKSIHVCCAALSISGFLLRGYWMWADSPLLRHRLTRVLPHINDTLLLIAAVVMAIQSRQYPLANDWLTAKLIALVAYVALGGFALKYGRTRRIRTAALIGAVAVFAYIVAVAVSRSPILNGAALSTPLI